MAMIARQRGQKPMTVEEEAQAWRQKWTENIQSQIRALDEGWRL